MLAGVARIQMAARRAARGQGAVHLGRAAVGLSVNVEAMDTGLQALEIRREDQTVLGGVTCTLPTLSPTPSVVTLFSGIVRDSAAWAVPTRQVANRVAVRFSW